MSYWLGPVQRASGRFADVHAEADIDDVAVVTLEFESGALASLTGSYVSPKTLSLRLLGTEMPQGGSTAAAPGNPGTTQTQTGKGEKKSKTPALDHFCRDLTQLAAGARHHGRADPLPGVAQQRPAGSDHLVVRVPGQPGKIEPDHIITPGVYVKRIVHVPDAVKHIEQRTVRKRVMA